MTQNTRSHHPLPADYRDVISSLTANIAAFIGKDPFPTGPTGLPFCKNSWSEQLQDNCSGKHLLQSIGVNAAIASQTYETPKELFMTLARQGIIMLNASYHFLDARGFPKVYLPLLAEANTINLPVIDHAQHIFLLGQAKVLLPYIRQNFPERKDSVITLIHPDTQNRRFWRSKWEETWLPDVLKNRFDLQITI